MSPWPELDLPVQLLYQRVYAVLLALTLLHQIAPNARRFLVSDRWGGYARSSPVVDIMHRPWLAPIVLAGWLACAVALACDWQPVAAGLINLYLCRYYFVAMRWRGVLRGFGAPGYMTYWLGLAVLLMAVTRDHAPALHAPALLFLQIDLALIIFSASFYKFKSGYRQGEGMDYGMVNPMWAYWPGLFRRLPVGHPIFRLLNASAWSSQFLAALLMVIPQTRWIGGLLILLTYLFIFTQIRLGWLAELMMLAGLLFFTAGSPPAVLIGSLPGSPTSATVAAAVPEAVISAGRLLIAVHLAGTVLCHAGLYYNFYGRRRLPAPLQRAVEIYSNLFGIIIWRVFTVDILNFHIAIHVADTPDAPPGSRRTLSQWRSPSSLRFWNVGEAITVTSLFTTLKYYPSNHGLFQERLVRYARTLPCPPTGEVCFEYVSIQKHGQRYVDRSVMLFHVDPRAGSVRVDHLDPRFSASATPGSVVHEAALPGSYAPKAVPPVTSP